MAAETVSQTWQRITGKPWSEAKKLGLTDGSAGANLALQKKLNGGFNPYAAQGPAAAPAPAANPYAETQQMIQQWYAQKPATPAAFNYSAEQEAADKRSVQDQYRPFYQEQVTQSNDQFTQALSAAREGFSRRGLWGAAAPTTTVTDPNTGLTQVQGGVSTANQPGIRSGLRMQGEKQISQANDRSNTAYGRAMTEAVAGGVQQRRTEAADVYAKTVRQPYEDQYKDWLARMQGISAGAK